MVPSLGRARHARHARHADIRKASDERSHDDENGLIDPSLVSPMDKPMQIPKFPR